MKKLAFIFSFVALVACNSPQTATSAQSNPSSSEVSKPAVVFPDTIWVDMDSMSHIYLGKQEVAFDNLSKRLTDSMEILKKQGMSQLPVLEIRTHGTVTMGVRGEVRDIFQEIQSKK